MGFLLCCETGYIYSSHYINRKKLVVLGWRDIIKPQLSMGKEKISQQNPIEVH